MLHHTLTPRRRRLHADVAAMAPWQRQVDVANTAMAIASEAVDCAAATHDDPALRELSNQVYALCVRAHHLASRLLAADAEGDTR
jgi:hypothetical protein